MGYTFPESNAAAVIAQRAFDLLEEYIENLESQKQLNDLKFVEASYEEAKETFVKPYFEGLTKKLKEREQSAQEEN